MGQNSSGSFALSDNMSSMLAFGVEHNLQIILDQINNDLVPQTLALNGWLMEQSEQPRLTYKDITPPSLEEISKFLQRVITSGAMTVNKSTDKALHELLGLPEPVYESSEMIPDAFKSNKGSSASKNTGGTSGTGNSQSSDAGSNLNAENTA